MCVLHQLVTTHVSGQLSDRIAHVVDPQLEDTEHPWVLFLVGHVYNGISTQILLKLIRKRCPFLLC
jgi:hypothetical protein